MANASVRPNNSQSKAFDAGIAAAVAWFATQGQTLADYRDAECQSLLQKQGDLTVIKDAFTEGFGKGLAASIAGVAITPQATGIACRGVNHG